MDEQGDGRLGMTEEQWAIFQKATHGFGEQNEDGIDLAALRENLKLTPTERIEKHQRFLSLVLELERAAELAGLRRRSGRP